MGSHPHLCPILSIADNGAATHSGTQAAKPTTNFLDPVSCPFHHLNIPPRALRPEPCLQRRSQGASNLFFKFHSLLVTYMPESIYVSEIARKKVLFAFPCISQGNVMMLEELCLPSFFLFSSSLPQSLDEIL